jgi:FkbM family methyltransferase
MGIWRSTLRPRVKPLIYRFRSKALYRVASFYVNAYDNDNDVDFETNGEARFARDRLRGAKVAFDVGAARGEWTEIALAADPGVTVHCFEPTARRIKILRGKNLDARRVVVNQLGCGDRATTTDIFYNASGGSNSIFPQRYGGERYDTEDVERISITTIDEYCKTNRIDRIDFIKMDIEGYEMSAIRGAESMLRAGRIGVLQFEYSYVYLDASTSLMQLMRYMNEVNPDYVFHKLYPDRAQPVHTYQHTLDNFKTQNWAIINTAF